MESERIGRYLVRGMVGRGAMATVYHAYDPLVGRDVALKMMSVALKDQPSFRARFEREVRTIASLEHAAIVPVYDFGEHENRLYLVMRLMKGGTLEQRIRQGAMSPAESLITLRQIAPAIEAAHERGIVHRDLKPANILFDAHSHAFLSDFGIVRVSTSLEAITARNAAIGTPAYMSPEQIQGTAVDGRSDIYALAVVLFQMLSGKLPYEAETPAKVMQAQIHATVPDISELVPTLTAACNQVLSRALAKRPEERYPTAGLFLTAFEEALHQLESAEITPLSMTLLESTLLEAVSAPPEEHFRYWRRDGRLIPVRRRELPEIPRGHIVLPTPAPLPPEPERPPSWSPQSRTFNVLLQKHEELLRQEVLRYQARLHEEYERAEQLAADQRAILEALDPPFPEMLSRIKRWEFWERRPGDEDFLRIRVAAGSVPAAFTVQPPVGPATDLRIQGARTLAGSFSRIGKASLTVGLGNLSSLHLGGAHVYDFANALLLRIAFHHAPQDVRIFLFAADPGAVGRWGWLKWLPHTAALIDSGDHTHLSFSAESAATLLSKLTTEIRRRQVIRRAGAHMSERGRWPRLVVLLDNAPDSLLNRELSSMYTSGQKLQMHFLTIGESPLTAHADAALRLDASGELTYSVAASTAEPAWKSGRAELVGVAEAEEVARQLASVELVGPDLERIEPAERVSFTQLFGAAGVDQLDLWRLYRESQLDADFSFPIGRDKFGEEVRIRLNGLPPGGGILVCGEPRSGRKNLLQGIVLGIAVAFAPTHIRLAIANIASSANGRPDVEADAVFPGIQSLPHAEAGRIFAESGAAPLLLQRILDEVERRRRQFQILESRLQRRVPDLATYNRFIPEEPLPAIVLLIDGFTAAWSEQLQQFLAGLGEDARAFGVHLVLGVLDASGLADSLIAAFPLRLCLRLSSEVDSRRIVGAPDAANLPVSAPGRAFIWRQESGRAEKFQAPALDIPRPAAGHETLDDYGLVEVLQVQVDGRRQPLFRRTPLAAPKHARTEADVIAEHVAEYCRTAGY